MGRLRYGMLVSLDGYARDGDGSFDWATPDSELHSYINDQEREIGTYVYGRGLWETMRYWQDPPAEDLADHAAADYAELWQAADKVVVSSAIEPPSDPRTEVWRELDLDRLATLVEASPTDVIIGGPTLAAAALRAGLVDELTAYVVPHVAGGGLPWLPDGVTTGLELREQRAFPGGTVALIYDVRKPS